MYTSAALATGRTQARPCAAHAPLRAYEHIQAHTSAYEHYAQGIKRSGVAHAALEAKDAVRAYLCSLSLYHSAYALSLCLPA